jgi:ubiquinone/menaquinone biosynthesis C-methylase UbiE
MQDEWKARHAGSFGGVAADYDAARPSYPAEAVAWLAGDAPLDVLDLGAGTGRLTELLVAAGHRVTAADPSTGMLEQLHRRLPGVATVVGAAENLPLPDAAFDVITVAQAWHWVDEAVAPRECARLLRPGGRLALVWNERDESVDWVRAVWEPLNRGGGTGMTLLADAWQSAVTAYAPFGPMREQVFRYEQTLSRKAVLRLVGSRSSVAVLDPPARVALLAEVTAVLDAHPDTRDRDELVLPYETRCYRWTRR